MSRAEPPEVFRATSAILPIQPGSIASARAPDPGPSRRCLRGLRTPRGEGLDRAVLFDARAVCRSPIRVSERVGLSGAEPRQYCRAVSAILHWSAEDSPTPSTLPQPQAPSPMPNGGGRTTYRMVS